MRSNSSAVIGTSFLEAPEHPAAPFEDNASSYHPVPSECVNQGFSPSRVTRLLGKFADATSAWEPRSRFQREFCKPYKNDVQLPRDPIFSKLGGKHRISQAAAQKRAAQIKRLPGRKTASAGGLGKPQGDERGDLLHQLFAKPQLVKSGVTSPDASWLGWLVLFPELAEKFSNEANRSNVCDKSTEFLCARPARTRTL
jgi:hypothetical protein